MNSKVIGAVTFLMVLGSGSVNAQIVPFSDDFELTKADLDSIIEVVEPILDDPNAQPGQAVSWTNDSSGSSGTVKFVRTLDLGQFKSCKKIQYQFSLAGKADPRQFVIDYCQVEDGVWKTYP